MPKTTIKSIRARQLVDCKCRPMVEVDIITEGGVWGRGSAPTGTSVGMYESYVLRDGDPKKYHGLSVYKAVGNVNDIIAPALVGMDIMDQRAIDERMIELDGTDNKRKLGGNAIYSTSVACLSAAAKIEGLLLYQYLAGKSIKTIPVPSFNVINGGRQKKHIQSFNEFLVMPYKASDIYEAVEIGIDVFKRLGSEIEACWGEKPEIAGSYGHAAPTDDPEEILELMRRTVAACGHTDKVCFALDCASSAMYDMGTKTYLLKGRRVTADELIDYVKGLTEKFNLVFVEDLLEENDWAGYAKAHKIIKRTNILGDDFIASNMARLRRANEAESVDGFILKPNQVGTITEAMDTYAYAKSHDLITVTSGRSGGVIGDVVMDMAVGLELGFIKNGAPRSGERIDKLNFLMRACDMNAGSRLSDITKIIKF